MPKKAGLLGNVLLKKWRKKKTSHTVLIGIGPQVDEAWELHVPLNSFDEQAGSFSQTKVPEHEIGSGCFATMGSSPPSVTAPRGPVIYRPPHFEILIHEIKLDTEVKKSAADQPFCSLTGTLLFQRRLPSLVAG